MALPIEIQADLRLATDRSLTDRTMWRMDKWHNNAGMLLTRQEAEKYHELYTQVMHCISKNERGLEGENANIFTLLRELCKDDYNRHINIPRP